MTRRSPISTAARRARRAAVPALLAGGVLLAESLRVERANAAFNESERRFRLAVDAARCGIWEWDLGSDTIFMSDVTAALFGWRGGVVEGQQVLDRVSPGHRDGLRDALATAAIYGGFDVSFRVPSLTGGRPTWIDARGQGFGQAAEGGYARIIGVALDVTEERLAQARGDHQRRAQPGDQFERGLRRTFQPAHGRGGIGAQQRQRRADRHAHEALGRRTHRSPGRRLAARLRQASRSMPSRDPKSAEAEALSLGGERHPVINIPSPGREAAWERSGEGGAAQRTAGPWTRDPTLSLAGRPAPPSPSLSRALRAGRGAGRAIPPRLRPASG